MVVLGGRCREWLRGIARDVGSLPGVLTLPAVVAATFFLVMVLGLWFALPPGPLCDEGMWLFMEGGCDWGNSNVFFHSKLGLMLMSNAVLAVALLSEGVRSRGLLPHLALLALLVTIPTVMDPGRCETYYGHPNGNLGQMLLEVVAFGTLGLAVISSRRVTGQSRLARVAVLVALNLLNVGLFHAWLAVVPHWTWTHTLLVVGAEALLALGIAGWSERAPGGVGPMDLLLLGVLVGLAAPVSALLEYALPLLIGLLVVRGGALAIRGIWSARI